MIKKKEINKNNGGKSISKLGVQGPLLQLVLAQTVVKMVSKYQINVFLLLINISL
jgi:hypothetical protein